MTPPGRRQLLELIPESDWQQHVYDYARRHRWLAYHTWDSRRSAAGFPDLVLVRAPHLVFAELKAHGKQLRPAQQSWYDQLSGVTCVETRTWWPTDEADMERLLQ